MKAIRSSLGIRFRLPAFRWLTEIGALLIRTETELILKSRWVTPERLLQNGFVFGHPQLDPALRDIVRSIKPQVKPRAAREARV